MLSKGMESFTGVMEGYIRASGKMGNRTVMECTLILMVKRSKGSGLMARK